MGASSLSSIKKVRGLKGGEPQGQRGLQREVRRREGEERKKYRTQRACFKEVFDE